MVNAHGAASIGVGYAKATSPMRCPSSPFAPAAPTAVWAMPSTTTIAMRAWSRRIERGDVTVMPPSSTRTGAPGHPDAVSLRLRSRSRSPVRVTGLQTGRRERDGEPLAPDRDAGQRGEIDLGRQRVVGAADVALEV